MTISAVARPFRLLAIALFPIVLLTQGATAQAQAGVAPATRDVQLDQHAFTRGDAIPDWVDQVRTIPAAMPGGPLSVRLADVQFHVGAAGTDSAVYTHRALAANEASSLSALGQYEIVFQPEYQHVQLHRLRILRGGQVIDKLQSADIRFLQRETGLDQGVYSGSITAAIVTEDVRVGDTLEMAYTIVGQNPVFGGKFFDAAAWDSPAPVSLRRITLDTPDNRAIYYRLIGDRGARVEPVERRHDGRRVLRFETSNLAALLGEPFVPNDVAAYRWIQFSEFDNWRDVDHWALGLFEIPPATAALKEALQPARAARTQQEAVAKVLEFVQNQIRYLSISMGENSHRPFPPAQVLQRRYGDCKDKSLLMVAMLHELGIEAQPVLLSTFYRKGLDRMLPSPGLFDHAIVKARVQGKLYYFDPTRLGQYGALDRMGQLHSNAQVLAIGAGALETIAAPDDPDLITDQRSEHVIATAMDQPVELQAHLQFAGVEAEHIRTQLTSMDLAQLRKAYESAMGRRYSEFTLLADPKISDDRAQNRLAIDLRYRISKFFEKDEQGWNMRFKPVNLIDQFYVPDLAKRELPVAVPNSPSIHLYDLDLTLPEQVDAHYRPDQQSLTSSAGTLTRAVSFTGNVMHAKLRLEVTADHVAPADMVAFVDTTRKMNEMLQGQLYVRNSVFKTAAAAPQSYQQTLQAQLQTSLKASSRVLADAKLTGQDPGGAWCERARLNAYLGRNAEAQQDAAQVLRRNSEAPENLVCHGDISFMLGNMKDSATDFTHAAAIDNSDGTTYQRRALAYLYLGNVRAAGEDLARAAAKISDPLEHTRIAIWQAIAAHPAAESGNPTKLLTEQWLSAALDMFQKNQPPDHMLQLASQDGGNGLEPRLVEAYFYAGKYYLLHQDKLRARVYFQRALDKGALNNPYHTLARLELARL